MATIREVVCRETGMSVEVIMSPMRVADIAIPRMLAMYLCRELTRAPHRVISEWWERDRTTSMYAGKVIPGYAEKDPDFATRVAAIRTACEKALHELSNSQPQTETTNQG
nr:helix-turn-helix domain-containing protein [Ruficoccus amylovorans]